LRCALNAMAPCQQDNPMLHAEGLGSDQLTSRRGDAGGKRTRI
jgi:hypothetical protein